mmetsp:Transcript_6535/g.12412  ORF Transcript_6535/g.12412 Transcript_6535/m.12412 type:complete len:248 (-) Transcript_6535:28-771(-)
MRVNSTHCAWLVRAALTHLKLDPTKASTWHRIWAACSIADAELKLISMMVRNADASCGWNGSKSSNDGSTSNKYLKREGAKTGGTEYPSIKHFTNIRPISSKTSTANPVWVSIESVDVEHGRNAAPRHVSNRLCGECSTCAKKLVYRLDIVGICWLARALEALTKVTCSGCTRVPLGRCTNVPSVESTRFSMEISMGTGGRPACRRWPYSRSSLIFHSVCTIWCEALPSRPSTSVAKKACASTWSAV